MRHRFGLTLTAIALTAVALPLTCAAQARLSYEKSGLGLRQQAGIVADLPSGGEVRQSWHTRQPFDFALFGGARELARIGPGPAETYGGVPTPSRAAGARRSKRATRRNPCLPRAATR